MTGDLEDRAYRVVFAEIERFLDRISDHLDMLPDDAQSSVHLLMVGMLLGEARHLQSLSSVPTYCEHVAAKHLQARQQEEMDEARDALYLRLLHEFSGKGSDLN